jgi:ATP-dependent DNA helicase RecQ
MRRMFIDDEDSSDERKRREHQRLGALISYCEASSCRRRTLLAYFGEDGAGAGCGNCDVCRNPAATVDGTKEARLILSAVLETGERYGATHVVDVLRGAETEKVTAAGHDRVESFGAGASRKTVEWRSLVRQLTAAGHLDHDVSGFGGLSVSQAGAALLRGETQFFYRQDPQTPRKSRKDREAGVAANLNDAETGLLGTLKQLRLDLARTRGVPAYLVFSDRTLIEMARHAPGNLSEFAMISGVGNSKLRDFGQNFVDAITAHRASA